MPEEIQEFDIDEPIEEFDLPENSDALERQRRKAALPKPELEPISGFDKTLARIGTGVEKSQQLPGRILFGALDLAQGLPGSRIGEYIGEKLTPDSMKGIRDEITSTPRKWLEYYDRRNKQLAKENAALDDNSKTGQFVEGLTQAGLELPTQLVGGVANAGRQASMKAVAAAQGLLSGLTKYGQERGEGAGRAQALGQGGASGLITGFTTRAFGQTGIESIFKNEGMKGIANRVLATLKEAGMEGAEEMTDTFLQDLVERFTKNPNKPIGETVAETLMAGGIGAALGGGVAGVHQARDAGGLQQPDVSKLQPMTEEEAQNAIQQESPSVLRPVREQPGKGQQEMPSEGGGQATNVGGDQESVAQAQEISVDNLLKMTADDFVKWKSEANLGEPAVQKIAERLTPEEFNRINAEAENLGRKTIELAKKHDTGAPLTQEAIDELQANFKNSAKAQTLREISENYTKTKGIPSGKQIADHLGAEYRGVTGKNGSLWQFEAKNPDGSPSTSFYVKAGSTLEQARAKYEETRQRYADDPNNMPRDIPESSKPQPQQAPVQDQPAQEQQATTEAEPEIEFTPLDPQSGSPIESNPTEAKPEFIGMGGATPSEFNPVKQFTTSNKNATVDQERQARGEPPMMQTERESNQAAWDEAMRQVDDNPEKQDALIAELEEKPRAVTTVENAMLMQRRISLRNEYEKALLRWRDAFESDNFERAADESQNVKYLSDRLSDLEDITKRTGAESGRSLQARKMMANEDFSLAAMELAAMHAKGRHLTAEETSELIRAQAKIMELQNALDAELQAQLQKELSKRTDTAMKDVAAEKKPKDPEAEREAAISAIKRKFEKGEIDEITPLIQKLARYFYSQGIRTRDPMIDALHDVLKTIDPGFTREQTQRAFSGYGDFRPLSKDEISAGIRDLKGQIQQVLKIEALEARKPLEKTGQERRAPSDEERRLIKQVNELKRKYGVVVTDPETQLRSALQSRKTYYQHRLADLKHEIATRERIVKTKSASPTDAELETLKAEYADTKREHESIFGKRGLTDEQRLKIATAAAEKAQARWQVRLENARKGIFDTGKPGRTVTSPELEAIRAKNDQARAEFQAMKDAADATKTPEARQMRALDNQIEELQRQIDQREVFPNGKRQRVSTPEIEAKRAQIAELKRQRQFLRESIQPKDFDAAALNALKARLWNRTAQLRQKLADGDFSKKTSRPVLRDAEANQLQAQLDIAKKQFKQGLEKDQFDRMSVFQKGKRRVVDAYDAARAIMTTGELSFLLRQGKFAALSHPIKTAKALPDTFRALFGNEAKTRAIDEQIHSHPDAAAAKAAKLALTETDANSMPLSKQEEITMGRYSDRIPVVKNFNQAAHVFLNKVRMDMWLAMRKSMSKSGETTPEEDKQIAMFVNEATGRGGLGKFESAAVPLARVFFSPRYLMSRLQMASGHSMWGGNARTRKVIAKEYARALIGMGLYYSLLSAMFRDDKDKKKGHIETDPRSSDFGKIRLGETRLDPLAGLGQVITLAARTASGKTKTLSGKVQDIRGSKVPFGGSRWTDVAARFGRTKLHPVPGAIANLFDGTDLTGQQASITGEIGKGVAPMTYSDIYDALKAQDLPEGAALSLLAFLGEGLQTYEKNKKK